MCIGRCTAQRICLHKVGYYSPAPVPHRGPSGQAQGAGPLTPGERENEDDQDEDILDDEGWDNANSPHCMNGPPWEHYGANLEGLRVEQWLTPQGLVNISRVEVIDPNWGGVDEPKELVMSEI